MTLSNIYEKILITEARIHLILQAGFPHILNSIHADIRGLNENKASLYNSYIAFVNAVNEYSKIDITTIHEIDRITAIDKVKAAFIDFATIANLKLPLIIKHLDSLFYGDVGGEEKEHLLKSAVGNEKVQMLKEVQKFLSELLAFIQKYEADIKNISKVNLDRYFKDVYRMLDSFIKKFNDVSRYLNNILKISYHGNVFNKIAGFIVNFLDFKALLK